MANTKEYLIRINGLEESINAVESLNKQLGLLESKINALSSKAVNISSSSGGGGSRSGALSEEEKLQKQIAQTEEKRIAYQKDIYQTLLAEKDLLKETVNDQKQVAAQERLTADAYSNTMQGMKDKLADIKAVMQTVDLGDVDTFEKLTKDANELNSKLLEIEKSYGQFGRNVGNYASAFDGLKNIQVTVGNTVREFGSAREAFRTLGEELKALSINGQANTKHADELREAYNKLKSAMDDATLSSKAMDEAMDWMQSFTSMASVGQGFKGFFGIGGDEIQRSIQKLVSLQNVLQGIEKINKQIDSGEGFGKYIGSLNKGVDKVTNRLLAFNRSLNGTGTYAKAASVAIKGFGMALKAVGIGLAITAISKLVDAFSDLFSSSKKVEEQNKRLQQSFDVLTNEIDRRNEALDAAQQAGIISEQEKLTAQFDNQLELLDRQVELLERRAALQGENIGIGSIKQGTSLLGDVDVFNSKISFTPNWGGAVDTVVNNMEELTTLYGRYTKALEEADKANEEWATALTLSGEEIRQNTEYYQNMRNQMEKMAFGHYVSEVQKLDRAYKDGRISAEFYEKKMKDLKKAMEVDQAYQNALVHMKDLFGENAEAADALAKSIDNIFRSIQRGDVTNLINIRNAISGLSRMLKTDLENAYDDIDQWEKEQINIITGETEAAEEARTAIKVTAQLKRKKLLEEHQKEELEEQRKTNEKALSSAKEYARNVDEAERDLINLRIQNLKEGLNKTLAQLEEERKAKLKKVEDSGKLVGEREEEINRYYDKKIEEEKKKHFENLEKMYKDVWSSIYDFAYNTQRKMVENTQKSSENERKSLEQLKTSLLDQGISSYGVQGKRVFSKSTSEIMGIISNDDSDYMKQLKQAQDLQRVAQASTNLLNLFSSRQKAIMAKIKDEQVKLQQATTDEAKEQIQKRIDAYTDEINITYSLMLKAQKKSIEFKSALKEAERELTSSYGLITILSDKMALDDESYSTMLSYIYSQRMAAIQTFWENRIAFETSAATKNYNDQLSLQKAESDKQINEANTWRDEELKKNKEFRDKILDKDADAFNKEKEELAKLYKSEEIDYKEYTNKAIAINTKYYDKLSGDTEQKTKELKDKFEESLKADLRIVSEHGERMGQIFGENASRLTELEIEKNEAIKKINGDALQARLQEFRDYTTAINELEQKQPVLNAWGTINFKETNENNRNLLESYETLANDIVVLKHKLQTQLKAEELSFDDFQNANRELDRFTADLGVKMDKVKYELSIGGQVQQFIQDFQQYFQELGNAIQTIMEANNSYQDYLFEKQLADLDKQNDILQKQLDKQEEILQKHSDSVNDIEDELSSARGDRRQHLIDQLNEEIRAERQAAAEKKQIEKQQEALQKKQDELDKQRKKAEYNRNLQSILVSGAMAAANGYATQPFIPLGLAMGTLAASLAAYQYAMAKKAKPFATGGVIVGKAHKDGGVPVLGGQATVEGGEFITNKRTTAQNTPLLEYINSKKKRIDLTDMIEFFNDKPRATIKNIRSKFADGGVLTTPNVDISNFSDRTIIVKDEGVYEVSVVDINRKQEQVKNIQVLAGIGK